MSNLKSWNIRRVVFIHAVDFKNSKFKIQKKYDYLKTFKNWFIEYS